MVSYKFPIVGIIVVEHFVVSDGDIVLFDGQNIESIADKRVKDTIFNDIDSDNFDRTYVVRDDKHHEIWVCYPSSGQSYSDKAAIWNWNDKTGYGCRR